MDTAKYMFCAKQIRVRHDTLLIPSLSVYIDSSYQSIMTSRILSYIEGASRNIVEKDTNFVTTNTIEGKSVSGDTVKQLSKTLNFFPDEKIELLYSDNRVFYFNKNVIVGITNYRLFKLEKEEISHLFRSDIQSVRQVKNNVWTWDKIECTVKNDRSLKIAEVRTFGIFHSTACAYFVLWLSTKSFVDATGARHHQASQSVDDVKTSSAPINVDITNDRIQ